MTTKLNRVQRTRRKGGKIPKNTLCVNRGTKMGNPFIMKTEADRVRVVRQYRQWILAPEQRERLLWFIRYVQENDIQHLACFCSCDKTCHADELIKIYEVATSLTEEE